MSKISLSPIRAVLALLAGLGGVALGWGSVAQAQVRMAVSAQVSVDSVDANVLSDRTLQIVREAVNAIAAQAQDEDAGEVTRLRRRAREAALSALNTQGYFSPQIVLAVVPRAQSQDEKQNDNSPPGERWQLTIKPGSRTQVGSVDLTFSGAIQAPGFAARRAALQEHWGLPPGQPFINENWSQAKEDWLDSLRRKDFFLARLAHTQATIYADDAHAALAVEADSGPRVRLGPLQIEGLRVVPQRLIERYVTYTPGDAFDQDRLDGWQQMLNDTAFFDGATVGLGEPQDGVQDGVQGDVIHLPLRVRVTEAPRRRLSASLGVDSDNGVRAEGLYRQNVVFGSPVRSSIGAGLDKNRRRFFYDLHLSPSRSGWQDSVGVLGNLSEISGVTNTRMGLGWKRQQTRKAVADSLENRPENSRVEYETRLGLVLAHDNTRIAGVDTYTVPTLVSTWQWLRRDVDEANDPRTGWLVDVSLGLGATLDEREPFGRASVRAQAWWSPGPRDVLTLRGEVGRVWSHTNRLPEDFGYRTGGVRSLRGYKYQSVGVAQGSAIVGAPTLAVFGLEYTHYLSDTLGVAAFVDVGDAAPSFGTMDLRWGYGLGGRVRTPAGAFGVDAAWGERDRKLRLYFSLGLAF